jgi:hypothetical protein
MPGRTERKARFTAAARRQGISESTLLKRLVNAALMTAEPASPPEFERVEPVAVTGKAGRGEVASTGLGSSMTRCAVQWCSVEWRRDLNLRRPSPDRGVVGGTQLDGFSLFPQQDRRQLANSGDPGGLPLEL